MLYFVAEVVIIIGRVFVNEGNKVVLSCLRTDGGVPSSPQWSKDNSGGLPHHVILV